MCTHSLRMNKNKKQKYPEIDWPREHVSCNGQKFAQYTDWSVKYILFIYTQENLIIIINILLLSPYYFGRDVANIYKKNIYSYILLYGKR